MLRLTNKGERHNSVRLLMLCSFPSQAEEEEVEASTSLSLEEQAADEVRRSLGLPSETRSMCGYLYR